VSPKKKKVTSQSKNPQISLCKIYNIADVLTDSAVNSGWLDYASVTLK
jgi:hypothetical protein